MIVKYGDMLLQAKSIIKTNLKFKYVKELKKYVAIFNGDEECNTLIVELVDTGSLLPSKVIFSGISVPKDNDIILIPDIERVLTEKELVAGNPGCNIDCETRVREILDKIIELYYLDM